MDSLLAKEAADQWSIEHDIDWQLPIRTPIWFRRRTYIKAISQFYHGERATQRVCNRLLDDLQHLDIEILLVDPQRSSARILPESWQAAVIA